MEKYEPAKFEDYQLDESDYEEEEVSQEEVNSEQQTETQEEPSTEESATEVENETPAEETTSESAVQTPEENARYAEQRRQKQLEERVKSELERERQQAPEFQVAKLLSDMYGMPVDELYSQLQEAALQKQAEERGLPIEVMKQLSEYEQQQTQLQEQLHFMQFQNWQNKVTTEAQQLVTQYPMLTQDDIEQAKFYLLETLQNPDIPLERAVFALHGGKITDSFKNLAKQEAMAEISGRKKGGLPPQSMKTSDGQTLSEEERYVARMMGLSEADYIKYK
ncbi:hypothetical protein UFOVP453_48 [uncultured Caudovirales phage]|uniref:Scaffolding protein n=1 Tax=uncultured Caudovirales phage TaxID=2100421 RepID=A0A6J5MD30_9CAUD|nr:hypothetical protein UFOVP453_48 [uncultured Caudovirales phage]